MSGSRVDDFNGVIVREEPVTVWCSNTADDTASQRVAAVMAALSVFDPENKIDGM